MDDNNDEAKWKWRKKQTPYCLYHEMCMIALEKRPERVSSAQSRRIIIFFRRRARNRYMTFVCLRVQRGKSFRIVELSRIFGSK